MTRRPQIALAVSALVLLAATAQAAVTAAQKCEAKKNELAAKYFACRQQVWKKALAKNTPVDYAACDAKLASTWAKTEAAAKGACPTEGDQPFIRDVVAGCTTTVNLALGADTCDPLAPPGGQGCGAGEKCTWVAVAEGPTPFGRVACAPDGTVALGGACTQGPAGAATGYDDCVAGAICIGTGGTGVCADLCGFDGGANTACGAGQACAAYAGLGANGSADPSIGACRATCDPLLQTHDVNGTPQSCGAGQGCYLLLGATDTIAVCAAAGSGTHDAPITGTTYANSCAPGFMPRQAVQGVVGNECAALCKAADVYAGHDEALEGGNPAFDNWLGDAATCASVGGAGVLPQIPVTGESCSHLWTRERAPALTDFSNTIGWCFNHASWKYDPDGAAPFSAVDAYPRCVVTTRGDVLPPLDASPHDDALYFGCVAAPSLAGLRAIGAEQREEPRLDRLGGYR